MNKLEIYLFFNGTCAEAIRFYEKALGGTARTVAVKDTPDGAKMPAEAQELLMHAHLDAAGVVLMASDWMDDKPYPGMHGFSNCLTAPSAAEAKSLFDRLADGGRVTAPFGTTFWSDGFGMLVDRFGAPWMVMSAATPQK